MLRLYILHANYTMLSFDSSDWRSESKQTGKYPVCFDIYSKYVDECALRG